MTNPSKRQKKLSDSWKDWHLTKEGKVDKDMPMLEKVFRKHGISKILDLGCGTGRHVVFFAERGFKVFGFDFSSDTIERAKKILRAKNLRVNLKVWDMAHPLPYEDGFFDAVVSIRVFHHSEMKTIKKIIAEIKRITRKGSYVYVQVPTLEKVLKYIEEGGKFQEIEPRTFVPLEGPEKGVPHHNFTKEELVELFKDFNIESITERDEHYNLLALKP